eukprot:scaffold36930_cov21-Tisochrysis_lutea.AAC.1
MSDSNGACGTGKVVEKGDGQLSSIHPGGAPESSWWHDTDLYSFRMPLELQPLLNRSGWTG